nr:DUF2147 domain-containing protein [uncultured Pedobacter sp.]
MKRTIILMAFFFATATVFAQSADAIVGKWLNKDGDAHIQIYKTGNKFNGKLVWLKNPNNEQGKAKMDVHNPDVKLRGRALWGLEILKGFSFDDGAWEDGTIYDPKSGKTYSCKMTMNGNDKLNVRGYIGISLIGRTDVWTRVK